MGQCIVVSVGVSGWEIWLTWFAVPGSPAGLAYMRLYNKRQEGKTRPTWWLKRRPGVGSFKCKGYWVKWMWGGGYKKQLTLFCSTCLRTSLLLFSPWKKYYEKVRTIISLITGFGALTCNTCATPFRHSKAGGLLLRDIDWALLSNKMDAATPRLPSSTIEILLHASKGPVLSYFFVWVFLNLYSRLKHTKNPLNVPQNLRKDLYCQFF